MRTLAIGDIHGCSSLLDDLIAWVAPTKHDLVIVLGDVVDRGPDSRGVLDRLIRLKQELNLVCLRGNHEIMMLEARRGGYGDRKMWMSVGGLQALGSYGTSPGRTGTLADVPEEHWQFLEKKLLPYYETESHIFVHAGLAQSLPLSEQPAEKLYWEHLPAAMQHDSGKIAICGHTSQKNGVPKMIPGAICIDTFAHGGGWLTCLDVQSGRYWQTDILGRKREGQLE